MSGIPLADAVSELREQIKEAMKRAEGDKLAFEIGSMELELQVKFESTTHAKTGVKVWFASLNVGGKASDSEIHRVKLSLIPKNITKEGGTREPVLISDTGN